MFGSKLRSWMENHIVRPRKKGTKIKNSNGAANAAATPSGCSHEAHNKKHSTATYGTHHGNGGVAVTAATPSKTANAISSSNCANHNGCCSGISSPVRRREVSPIQGHTQSRYGWQSPDKEVITSPKSDNFLYAPQHHRVKSHQMPHLTAPENKDNCSDDKSIVAKSQYNQLNQQSQQQKLQKRKKQQQRPADCSSSSISSLSWSTGSKEPSVHSNINGNSSVKQAVEIQNASFSDLPNLDEDPDVVHYEEVRTILRHPEHMGSGNDRNDQKYYEPYERPKSEQLTSFAAAKASNAGNRSQDDASTRYGRLLPSKIQNCNTSIDELNARGHPAGGSIEYICSSVRNSHSRQSDAVGHMTTSGANLTAAAYHANNYSGTLAVQNPQSSTAQSRRYGNERTWNGTAHTTCVPGTMPMYSLSSPESAYSTGYSTDGTSPGAIYTPPEYYINIRTGTHYFPKSINSLAIEAQRYKFGLNKIEEMSPIEPVAKSSFPNASATHKRVDSFDTGYNKNSNNANNTVVIEDQLNHLGATHPLSRSLNVSSNSPLALRSSNVYSSLKGIESPSPRQRSRIRTNPWYSTPDTSSSVESAGGMGVQLTLVPPLTMATAVVPTLCSTTTTDEFLALPTKPMTMNKRELAAGTSLLSKTKPHDEQIGKTTIGNGNDTSESSSSLTEVENMHTPNTIRRKRTELFQRAAATNASTKSADTISVAFHGSNGSASGTPYLQVVIDGAVTVDCKEAPVSDDDATLNEMMGKFDESYVYEKETDILSSDSDPTDCPSDLDTGQDAGDECDTDELLDIDFIDTSSAQEVYEHREVECNLGGCYYFNHSPKRSPKEQMQSSAVAVVRSRRISRSLKTTGRNDNGRGGGTGIAVGSGAQRRRKRFMKTRKKSNENRDYLNSPRKARQSRSAGGTPVCLRRKHSHAKSRLNDNATLFNRSSSMGFMDARDTCRFMTIAESEKALLKADIEADVKYRQLILEAESILVSIKSSLQSIPRDTPVSSPRRVNPLANKRVEMLKNCESEPKRDKHSKHSPQRSMEGASVEQELAAAINRRIEKLRSESASAPNSPKFGRCSPRKTHLTNFINQNVLADVPQRNMAAASDGSGVSVFVVGDYPKASQTPQIQLNGNQMQSGLSASPLHRQRFRSQSVSKMGRRLNAYNGQFDSDCVLRNSTADMVSQSYLPEFARVTLYDETDLRNQNFVADTYGNGQYLNQRKSPQANACPQSEPLKRKVYKGSSTFERIKRSFDLETEMPKEPLLVQVHNMRRREYSTCDPQTSTAAATGSASQDCNQLNGSMQNGSDACVPDNQKKQMILNTIADLKRSLENQSIELNGWNED